MQTTKCAITITNTVNNNSDRHKVENVIKVTILLDHLFVDAPEVLTSARHIGRDVQFEQTCLHLGDRLRQVDLALG
jgi:hypothetical protein